MLRNVLVTASKLIKTKFSTPESLAELAKGLVAVAGVGGMFVGATAKSRSSASSATSDKNKRNIDKIRQTSERWASLCDELARFEMFSPHVYNAILNR